MTRRKCSRDGCGRPAKARELCAKHYDRERPDRHRHREDRILASRARNRALAELSRRHPDEFKDLWRDALEQVRAEAAELSAVAEAAGLDTADGQVVRLKRGPAAEDEVVTDRVVAVPPCSQCDEYHAAGHRCLHCGALPSRAIPTNGLPILVPAEMTDERIAAAVAAGERRSSGETA